MEIEHKSNYEGGGDEEIWGEVSDILGELFPKPRKKVPKLEKRDSDLKSTSMILQDIDTAFKKLEVSLPPIQPTPSTPTIPNSSSNYSETPSSPPTKDRRPTQSPPDALPLVATSPPRSRPVAATKNRQDLIQQSINKIQNKPPPPPPRKVSQSAISGIVPPKIEQPVRATIEDTKPQRSRSFSDPNKIYSPGKEEISTEKDKETATLIPKKEPERHRHTVLKKEVKKGVVPKKGWEFGKKPSTIRGNDPFKQQKRVTYNGATAKALIDQDSDGNDGVLEFKKNDVIFITNCRVSSVNDKKGIGGGMGLYMGYFKGVQGYVPIHGVQPFEISLAFRSEKDEIQISNYKPLLELLVKPDLSLALAFCSVLGREDVQYVVKSLVSIFQANGNILQFIEKLMEHEINQTSSETTLFRGNSIASGVMTTYSRIIGKGYLKHVLRPVINEVKAAKSLELDPTKLEPGEDKSVNMANMLKILRNFLKEILDSSKICPVIIKNMCNMLVQKVLAKFPKSNPSVIIGGFFFLRFLSPAMVSAETLGIAEVAVDDKTRRGLIILSKILQNIANSHLFMEDYMMPLNSVVTEFSNDLKNFFDEISNTFYEGIERPSGFTLINCIEPESLHRLYNQINVLLSKIGFWLEEKQKIGEIKGLNYSPFESLLSQMSSIGPPQSGILTQKFTHTPTAMNEHHSAIARFLSKWLLNRPQKEVLVEKKILS